MAGKVSFQFKQFTVKQEHCAMKVGTDGVLLGSWASGGTRILDIGTGTGLLCLMMAQRFPYSHVEGVEIDGSAAIQAVENVANSPFFHRVTIHTASIQTFARQALSQPHFVPYDSIVSNPPYFIRSLKNPDSGRSLARHTDTLSYRDLLDAVKILLADEGKFSVVIPVEGCLKEMLEESVIHGLFLNRRVDVKTVERKAPKRCLLEFVRHRVDVVDAVECVLQDNSGKRSDWYDDLTKDFYIKRMMSKSL